MRKTKIHFVWENTTPSTELPRDFYAGIGPLQLGVVLVLLQFYLWTFTEIYVQSVRWSFGPRSSDCAELSLVIKVGGRGLRTN